MKRFCIVALIALAGLPLWGENLQVVIRYFDKTVHYIDGDIQVKVEVTNAGSETARLRVTERREFNLDFDVRTLTNVRVEHSQEYRVERTTNEPLLYREVILLPGETYSFVETLGNYVDLPGPGLYVVKADFYPDLAFAAGSMPIESNQLSLSVRPSVGTGVIMAEIDRETGEILRRENLPPDQVVSYTISARQKSQWEKFFLYLDLESLLSQDDEAYARYLRMSEQDRQLMLARYKDSFRQEVTSDEIALIPREFEIIKTVYTEYEGTVQAIEKFEYSDFTEVKRFTYYLRKVDGVWTIYDYEVRNLGTE